MRQLKIVDVSLCCREKGFGLQNILSKYLRCITPALSCPDCSRIRNILHSDFDRGCLFSIDFQLTHLPCTCALFRWCRSVNRQAVGLQELAEVDGILINGIPLS
jgi:hypothetical protein